MKFLVRSRFYIQNDQIQHFIPVLLSNIEFCGVHMAYCILRSTKTKYFDFHCGL